MCCVYAFAEDNVICVASNIIEICGKQKLLNELSKSKELVVTDDPYLSEIKRTAKKLHNIDLNDAFKAYIILPINHSITTYWHSLVDKTRESISFGFHLDNAILDIFYKLYPTFPKLGVNGMLYRVILEAGTAKIQNKDNIKEFCAKYVKNIFGSTSVDLDSKKCFAHITQPFLPQLEKSTYNLLLSHWVIGYYYKSILNRKDYPKVVKISAAYSNNSSPSIDMIGNLYLPEIFLESNKIEDLKLLMLHEVSHLKLFSKDLNYVGKIDASNISRDRKINKLQNRIAKLNRTGGSLRQVSYLKRALASYKMIKQLSKTSMPAAENHSEELVDLFALSLIDDIKQQNKYIDLINRYGDISKGRLDAAKKAMEYITAGYSPMRLLAVQAKRNLLSSRPMPLIPIFSRQKYIALSPRVENKEKEILNSYDNIIMNTISSIFSSITKVYGDDKRSLHVIKKEWSTMFQYYDLMK